MPSLLCSFTEDPTECARQLGERMATYAPGQGQPYNYDYDYDYDHNPQKQQKQDHEQQNHHHHHHHQQQQQHQHYDRYYHRPRWSLNDLSTELLAMIFEQLRDIDTRHVSTARLLCRRFNHIATPITYRTLVLTDRITSHDAEQHFPRALAHIYAYTNHIIASSKLDPVGTRRILERIQNLSTVRWRYVDREVDPEQFWMPADVLNVEQTRFNDTRLYVEELPLRDFEGELRDIYIRAIPVNLLVSLKTACPSPPLVTRLNSLKHLLIAARRLEVLRFEDRGQGTLFEFAPHERLPAFRELSLQSYDWRHTPWDVAQHWDFSRITSLELISVPIYNFLSSVDFRDLANLHNLHCEDFSAHHPSPDSRADATRGLYVLIRSYIRALTALQITVHTDDFPAVDALLPHADSLTTLRLRDHTGFDEEDRRCPTMAHADLALLARHLRRLQALELDMDSAQTDPPVFLRAVCGFPLLHTLTLHVQTVLSPFDESEGDGYYHYHRYQQQYHLGADRDYEAAVWVFRFLVRNKPAGSAPWRSITINVGGWKRVMVRRLSEAWRGLNAKGVFAERCFVAERAEGFAGGKAVVEGMVIREEFPVDSSRHVTPESDEQQDDDDDDDEDNDDNDDDDDE